MKKKISFYLLLLISLVVFSQNEANIWYFGRNAGLDFSSGDPVAITNGALSTVEGCSSFSDQNGNLLFYSDGITVYNKNHQVMQNGNNLGGNPSSAQSGLIVPSPANANIFYLFTVGTNAVGNSGFPQNAGFKYYTIDMSANGGLGKVNNGFVDLSGSLSDNWTEKVTAVQGDGCNSIWVISLVGRTFYSYLIDSNGVSNTPVISTVVNDVSTDARGYLKVSPDATKIVSANMGAGTYLYDFDNVTGLVSNGHQLNVLDEFGYGIGFSLNSKVLYIATGNYLDNSTENLYQFNLDLPNFNSINSSRTLIKSYLNTRGALQLAPNGKIYWTSDNSQFISVINNPENLGIACNYSHLSVDLGGKQATQGLPPFIQSLFLPNVDIINDGSGVLVDQIDLCSGETYTLQPDISAYPATTTYQWTKDNLSLNPSVSSSSLTVDGVTYGAGNYKVLIDFNDGVTCPFYGEAQVDYHPTPVIINPITIRQCDDDTDGFAAVDLTLINENISANYLSETFTYFQTQADAENGDLTLSIANTTDYYTNSTGANPLWIRVETPYCHVVGQVDIIVSTSNTNFNTTLYKCDDYIDDNHNDYDGISEFDLTQIEANLLTQFPATQQANLSFSYYGNLNDAQLQTNAILNPSTYRNSNTNTTITAERIFIRVNNNSNIDCVGLGNNLYIDLVVEALPIAHQPNELRACETVVNSAEGEFDTTNIPNQVLQGQTGVGLSYFEEDTNGNLVQIPTNTFISTHYLSETKNIIIRVTNNSTNDPNRACYDETTVQFKIMKMSIPTIKVTIFDNLPNNYISVLVTGLGGYEFAIDNESFVDGNELHGHIFYNVDEGLHTIHVNDKNGCTSVVDQEVVVIRFPKYISPNQDGQHDEFYVYGGDAFKVSKVTIFNRFGKIMTILKQNEKWDGTYLGKLTFETDYWFVAEFIDNQGKIYKRNGHFSLKL